MANMPLKPNLAQLNIWVLLTNQAYSLMSLDMKPFGFLHKVFVLHGKYFCVVNIAGYFLSIDHAMKRQIDRIFIDNSLGHPLAKIFVAFKKKLQYCYMCYDDENCASF